MKYMNMSKVIIFVTKTLLNCDLLCKLLPYIIYSQYGQWHQNWYEMKEPSDL